MEMQDMEKNQEDIVEGTNVVVKPENLEPKSKNKFAIVSVVLVLSVILVLLGVAVYYIVVTPKIHKSLTSLPTNGYLYVTDLNKFPFGSECEKMTTDDFNNLTDVILSLKSNGTQSFAFYCPKMITPTGLVPGVVEPLSKFLKEVNRFGVSIGIIILEGQLGHKESLDGLKNLPFLSFYHYVKDANKGNSEAIKSFGAELNQKLPFLVERTNNLIWDSDDFKSVDIINTTFGKIDGVVVPVTALESPSQYKYPESITLMFMPRKLNLVDDGFKPIDHANVINQMMLVSRCTFLSNASALVNQDGIAMAGPEQYLAKMQNLDATALSFIEYLKDYVKLKISLDIWGKVERAVTIKSVLNPPNKAMSYSFAVPTESKADFTQLLLLQNVEGGAENKFTYNLIDFGVPANSKAQVLISHPQPYSLKTKTVIKTDKVTLPIGGSIVVAIYNDDKAKDLTDVSDAWPIPPPSSP